MTRRAAICTPLRTPVGKFLGGLSSLNAGQLGAVILKALMERSGIDPARVDDVVFSQGYGNGEAPAIGHRRRTPLLAERGQFPFRRRAAIGLHRRDQRLVQGKEIDVLEGR